LSLGNTPVRVYACPSDNTVIPGQGNLSYVVNGGVNWHWKINIPAGGSGPTVPVYGSTGTGLEARRASENFRNAGMFFLSTTQEYAQSFATPLAMIDQKPSSLDSIKDGATTTVMLSENLNAGRNAAWENATYPSNWACPHPWNTSFFVNGFAMGMNTFADAGATGYNYNVANNRGSMAPPLVTGSTALEGGINGDLSGANEGAFPYPNSNHSGIVNVTMADGSSRTINESIDNKIWVKLVSPNGSKIVRPTGGTLNGAALETNGQGYTQAVLNDSF
jgi:hypothetical protein